MSSDFGQSTLSHSRSRRWLLLAILIGVLGLAAANFALRASDSKMDRLKGILEASLYYPGSLLIRDGGNNPTPEADAAVWKQLGTDATEKEVLEFYERELVSRGLTPGAGLSVTGTSREGQVCAWHTSDYVFRLSFWRIEEWRLWYPEDSVYPTIYEIRLLEAQNVQAISTCRFPIE